MREGGEKEVPGLSEDGKIMDKTPPPDVAAGSILGSLSPEQLKEMLAAMRAMPGWKGMIEQEAELLGLFEEDDEPDPDESGMNSLNGQSQKQSQFHPEPVTRTEREAEPSHLRETGDEEHDDRDFRFMNLMRACRNGWTVSVKRLYPTWAAGFCDDYEMDGETPLSLKQLEQDWGGGKYRVWVKDVNAKSHGIVTVQIVGTPKKYGIPVYPPNDPRSMPAGTSPQGESSIVTAMMKGQMELNAALLQNFMKDRKSDLPIEQLDRLLALTDRLRGNAEVAGVAVPGVSDELKTMETVMSFIRPLIEKKELQARPVPVPPDVEK